MADEEAPDNSLLDNDADAEESDDPTDEELKKLENVTIAVYI